MKRMIAVASVAALALSGALPALAQELAPEDEEAAVSFHLDAATGGLTFAYGVGLDCAGMFDETDAEGAGPEETGEAIDSAPIDDDASSDDDDASSDDDALSDVDDSSADDDTASDDVGMILIGECNTISVLGPNGQLNHGSVMSAVVHAIKASDYDGPRGHLVREFARSDLGKKDKLDDQAGTDGEPKNPGKAPKGKSDKPGKGNNGKGNNGKAKGKKS